VKKIEDKPVSDLLSLSGKNAVVTGAAAGIGYGIAKRLSEAGAAVLITDINQKAIETAEKRLNDLGLEVKSKTVDVSRESAVKSIIKFVSDNFGGLDILVNNAGIYPVDNILEMTAEQWSAVLKVNLEGTFMCSREAGLKMAKQGRGGVIINIASMGALKPSMVGLAHYEASKAGVLGFTRSLALEMAPHKVRAVAVSPGGIWTEGTRANAQLIDGVSLEEFFETLGEKVPLGGFGNPDDIARVVLFLASDAASYITGTNIVVDGGALLC